VLSFGQRGSKRKGPWASLDALGRAAPVLLKLGDEGQLLLVDHGHASIARGGLARNLLSDARS